MKILSCTISDAAHFDAPWSIDFETFTCAPVPKDRAGSVWDAHQGVLLLMEGLTLAFFGKSANLRPSLSDNASVVVCLTLEGQPFRAIWKDNEQSFVTASGAAADQSEILAEISRLSHLSESSVRKSVLIRLTSEVERRISASRSPEEIISSVGTLPPAETLVSYAREVASRIASLVAASEQSLSSLRVLSEAEEESLQRKLVLTQQSQQQLRKELADTSSAIERFGQISAVKEEIGKLTKQLGAVNADCARFDIKRAVLEKALSTKELLPEYNALQELRTTFQNEVRIISELKKAFPGLNEKVRSASNAANEAERTALELLEGSKEKEAAALKVTDIDLTLLTSNQLLKSVKERCAREAAVLKLQQEEIGKLRTHLSQLTIKDQLLQKKMGDSSTDAELVNDVSLLESQISEVDLENQREADCTEEQKNVQKAIEKSRAYLADMQADLSGFKNEEYSLTNDLAMKERLRAKLLNQESEQSLYNELEKLNAHLQEIHSLQDLIQKLNSDSEAFNSEKTKIENLRHAIRLSSVALGAAQQTLKDKNNAVELARQADDFYKLVLFYEEERKKLTNGKPCPLCGAIHHPYSSKPSFDSSTGERLAKAQREADDALKAERAAQENYDNLRNESSNAERRCVELDHAIEEAKNAVLSRTTSMAIAGLREKKPLVWSSILKQRESALSSKREELSQRIEKLTDLTAAMNRTQERINELGAQLQRGKDEGRSVEESLKENQQKEQFLIRSIKEASSNKTALLRKLERSFARFGIKASTISLFKQNIQTLVKRREQWLNWSAEKESLHAEIAAVTGEVSRLQAELAAQKELSEHLESDSAELSEKIKKLQKERLEIAGGSFSSEEISATAESQKSQAETLLTESRLALNTRSFALSENQQSLARHEENLQNLQKELDERGKIFTTLLHQHHFSNESGFIAAQIPDAQLEELQKQNAELEARKNLLTAEIQSKEEQIRALSEDAPAEQSKEDLKEKLEQIVRTHREVCDELSQLREDAALNDTNKLRRRWESAHVARLKEEREMWIDLGRQAGEGKSIAKLSGELLFYFAAELFSGISLPWALAFEDGKLKVVMEKGSATERVSVDALSAADRIKVSFALLCARSRLNCGSLLPPIILFDIGPKALSEDTRPVFRVLLDFLGAQGKTGAVFE